LLNNFIKHQTEKDAIPNIPKNIINDNTEECGSIRPSFTLDAWPK
jgi:hypothetical protein